MLTWYDWHSARGWRWFDDGAEWKQVDKVGHAWTTFQLSRIAYLSAQKAGYPPQKALWMAAALAWSYQTTIEVSDGFFPKWGLLPGTLWAIPPAASSSYFSKKSYSARRGT
jgi:hypothetical protein